MAFQLTGSTWLSDNQEEPKIIIFSEDGRYIGAKKQVMIDSNNYLLIEENKEDVKLKFIIDKVFLGSNEILYELEKIHKDFCIIKEVCKNDYYKYLHLIL